MNFGSRIFALLLAIVPAIWGMCPCGFVEVCAHETTVGSDASDPCCSDDEPTSVEAPPERGPARHEPCKGCALMETGHGVLTPAPAVLPVASPAVAILSMLPTLDALAARVTVEAAVTIRGPGPPLAHLATVVLLI